MLAAAAVVVFKDFLLRNDLHILLSLAGGGGVCSSSVFCGLEREGKREKTE